MQPTEMQPLGPYALPLYSRANAAAAPQWDTAWLMQGWLQLSDEAIVIVDRSLRIVAHTLKANEGCRKITGKPLSAFGNMLELVEPGRQAYIRPQYYKVLGGETVETQYQTTTCNGTEVHFKTTLKPFTDAAGIVVGVWVHVREITQQVASEKAYGEAEQRWRFALEGSNHGVWDWNIQTGYCYFGPSYLQLYGFGPDDIRPHIDEWHTRTHPQDRAVIQEALDRHLNGADAVYECVYRMQRKHGDYVWILARGMITERDSTGQALRMVGTHTNINEHKLVEENFQNLFYRHPQPLLLYDADSEVIVEANAAAEKLYGYRRQQLLRMKVSDLEVAHGHVLPWYAPPQPAPAAHLQRQHHRSANGNIFIAHITHTAINYFSKQMQLIAISDVTEKVMSEAKLQQSELAYRNLFFNNPLPCIIFQGGTGQIEKTNAAACQLFGMPEQALTGVLLSTLLPNLASKKTLHQASDAAQVFDASYETPGGQVRQLELHQTKVSIRPGDTHYLLVVHDLTLINEAKESLERSNLRFQLISEISMDAVYDYDVATDSLQWNDGLMRLFGHLNKQLSILERSRLVHEDDYANTVNSLEKAMAHPGTQHWIAEYRFQHKNGSYHHVLDRALFVRDSAGKLLRMIGAMRDITDSWHQQGLLRIEKKILKQSNGINISPEELCKYLIQGIEVLHPHLRCAVVTLNAQQFMHTIAAPSLDPSYVREINGLQIGPNVTSFGKAMYDRTPVITTDVHSDAAWQNFGLLVRTHHLTACWAWPVYAPNRNVLGAFVVYCSEKRAPDDLELQAMNRCQNMLQLIFHNSDAAAQIRLYNDRLNSVMKATHDLVWDWNLETGVFFRDETCMQEVYGIKQADGLSNIYHLLERVHKEDRPQLERSINEALTRSDVANFEIEYRFLNDNQEYNYIFDRAVVIRDEEGKAIRMVGAAQNITDRKRMEQAFLQQELEKQRLIGKATIETQEKERGHIGKELHDNVNQILTTTKLYLELAQTAPELKDELILKSGKNIAHVINEIRSLSRSLMDPTLGDLGLVESINDLIENVNLTRRIRARLQVVGAPETSLNKEQQLMLFRIIQEITNNAVKHARAENLMIELVQATDHFRLTVTDDGQGFDPARIKKGSGLLNIQNRVSLVSGTLKIESTPNGTTMHITFPIN